MLLKFYLALENTKVIFFLVDHSKAMVTKSQAEEMVRVFERLDVDGDDLVSRAKLEEELEQSGLGVWCIQVGSHFGLKTIPS